MWLVLINGVANASSFMCFKVCECAASLSNEAILLELSLGREFGCVFNQNHVFYSCLLVYHLKAIVALTRTPLPAGILSVFDMFNTMDDDFRQEAAALVEYMYCPEGT